MKKIFIIDTSVLLYHEDSIHAFPGQDLHIPMVVLEELDTFKVRRDNVGNASRYVNRFLDSLRGRGSFSKGIEMDNKQVVFVNNYNPEGSKLLDFSKNDNVIIGTALDLKNKNPDSEVILVTRDISMRIKADSLGVKSEDYNKEKAVVDRKNAYTGVRVINISGSDMSAFYSEGKLEVEEDLHENEFVVLKSGGSASALGRYYGERINALNTFNMKGTKPSVKPKNKEQTFAMDAIYDKNISMMTITGMAGCGKTFLSIAGAVDQMFNGDYERLVLTRPNISLSRDIGFLKGSKEEKMQSWVQPIYDNLKIAFSSNSVSYFERMKEDGKIEVEALAFIRGRSLKNTVFIIDEAQNITYSEAKAVLTRMGEGSKIILLGDVEQIDAPHLDATSSGLSSIVELFKEFDEAAHITLLKGERSRLATFAAKTL